MLQSQLPFSEFDLGGYFKDAAATYLKNIHDVKCKVTSWIAAFILNSLNNGMCTGVSFSRSSPSTQFALQAHLPFTSVHLKYAKKLCLFWGLGIREVVSIISD